MIQGTVTADGVPTLTIHVAGQDWPATIDTGFNGDLELPEALRHHVNPRFNGRVLFILAGGQRVEEDGYEVDFPFDGQLLTVDATFVPDANILIGTHLLRHHRLEIDFVARTVLLERVP